MEKTQVKFIETWGMVIGLDQPSKKGFCGSRINHFRIIDEEDVQLLDELTQVNMKHPLKNRADLLTLYTAIKENMDYLVTEDMGFKKSLQSYKMKRNTKVQIIDNEGFKMLL